MRSSACRRVTGPWEEMRVIWQCAHTENIHSARLMETLVNGFALSLPW